MADGAPGRRRLTSSVRVRITLAAALVTGAAVALTGWLLLRAVEDTQTGRINDEVRARVATVVERLEDGAPWREAVVDVVPVVITDEDGDVIGTNPVTIEGPGGELYQVPLTSGTGAGGGGTVTGGTPSRATADSFGAGTVAPGFGDVRTAPGDGPPNVVIRTDGEQTEVEYVHEEVETERYGPVRVTALAPVDEVRRSVEAVADGLWRLLPALVGVVAAASWWLAGRALRPVEAIRAEAEAIGGDTIDRRLPEPPGDDEIARLARTMNDMLGRLEDSAQRQRQFVSDASHELRSPVAAIRTDLEVALHEGDRADWPTVARAVLAEESRLERLLGDLLVLASDDEAASLGPRAEPVDLADLAAEEAGRGRRVPVRFDRPADAGGDAYVVLGVASRLERALANLVDNAARHADSTVRLSVARRGDRVRLVVDDDGPGVPAIDRERIFERFARLDASRARDRGGAGLGLAVVRSIATRHGGYVWADAGPLGGARFTIELPAPPPSKLR
ncbi:MAG TPA: HAMP domain-containing sensor histidine kinase [Acidimicrobiales bacterium]